MSNMNLNAGGVIGALLAGGIAAAVIFTQFDVSESSRRGPAKLIILAVAGGAAAGNFLWARFFSKPEQVPSEG